jgi:hypothetical protein
MNYNITIKKEATYMLYVVFVLILFSVSLPIIFTVRLVFASLDILSGIVCDIGDALDMVTQNFIKKQ